MESKSSGGKVEEAIVRVENDSKGGRRRRVRADLYIGRMIDGWEVGKGVSIR